MNDIRRPIHCTKVLIVDDNAANVVLVEKILESVLNVVTLSANNAGLGLELAEANCPELILLDINMPGMNGFQVLRKLRASAKTRNIRVIAFSADDLPEDSAGGADAQFDGFLAKPIDLDELVRVVESVKAPTQ